MSLNSDWRATTTETFASDLEATEQHRRKSPRNSRWLVVPSGWMLLLCLVLPVFPMCHGDSLPLAVFTPAWAWVLAGMVTAIIACSTSRAAIERRGAFILMVLRGLSIGVVVDALIVMSDHGPSLLAIGIGVVAVLVAVALPWRATELLVILICTVFAATFAVVMTLLALDRDILWGATFTAVVAWTHAVGGVWWLAEAWRAPLPTRA
ncbi:MAG TPA: hypothetical protein VGM90_40190 [Kofleriaceae bacterium]